MRLYVGTAQDIVVQRTIDKNEQKRVAGNLYDREVIVKYEIENFKDKAGHARRRGEPPAFRNEVLATRAATCSGNWARKPRSQGPRTRRRAPSRRSSFTSTLPARGADGKAEKIVQKLHLVIKNEW